MPRRPTFRLANASTRRSAGGPRRSPGAAAPSPGSRPTRVGGKSKSKPRSRPSRPCAGAPEQSSSTSLFRPGARGASPDAVWARCINRRVLGVRGRGPSRCGIGAGARPRRRSARGGPNLRRFGARDARVANKRCEGLETPRNQRAPTFAKRSVDAGQRRRISSPIRRGEARNTGTRSVRLTLLLNRWWPIDRTSFAMRLVSRLVMDGGPIATGGPIAIGGREGAVRVVDLFARPTDDVSDCPSLESRGVSPGRRSRRERKLEPSGGASGRQRRLGRSAGLAGPRENTQRNVPVLSWHGGVCG